jgi:hypothetical protein
MEDRERLRIVLRHLIEHNEGHLEDHKRWIELARSNGQEEVARLIGEANSCTEKAGNLLKEALGLLLTE